MQLAAQTGPRGKVVSQNSATLTQALAQGATTMHIAEDIFADNDLVTIGEEDILITSHGTPSTVVRGQNNTQDTNHANGQNVRLSAGTTLLSHSFDGSTYLSAVRCGGEIEALFGLEIDSTIKYIAISTPYQLEVLFPMARYKPANNTVIKVLVWTWAAEAVFWAQYQS
ncbi:MAG TPA: hypothetical protein VM123_16420 [archaeon]|nr:hypothetical protein [archaeon]